MINRRFFFTVHTARPTQDRANCVEKNVFNESTVIGYYSHSL